MSEEGHDVVVGVFERLRFDSERHSLVESLSTVAAIVGFSRKEVLDGHLLVFLHLVEGQCSTLDVVSAITKASSHHWVELQVGRGQGLASLHQPCHEWEFYTDASQRMAVLSLDLIPESQPRPSGERQCMPRAWVRAVGNVLLQALLLNQRRHFAERTRMNSAHGYLIWRKFIRIVL